jgi:hypothetical protein
MYFGDKSTSSWLIVCDDDIEYMDANFAVLASIIKSLFSLGGPDLLPGGGIVLFVSFVSTTSFRNATASKTG